MFFSELANSLYRVRCSVPRTRAVAVSGNVTPKPHSEAAFTVSTEFPVKRPKPLPVPSFKSGGTVEREITWCSLPGCMVVINDNGD
jgi:hypothetical protein